MKKAIIIDDEKKSRVALDSFISKYCPTITIIDQADGVASGVFSIQKNNPDLVFLDIEMDDGTGFDILEKLENHSFEVIFVTAYNQYALKAFRFSAVDYLLKPVNPEELIQAVSRLSDDNRLDQIEKKLETLLSNKNTLQKLAFPSMEGLRIEVISNIVYCESDNYYTRVHLLSGEKLVVTRTLKEYDQILGDAGFFRIHQKFLVNLSYLKSYSKSDGGFVTLENGIELPVSRRKKDDLLQLITN